MQRIELETATGKIAVTIEGGSVLGAYIDADGAVNISFSPSGYPTDVTLDPLTIGQCIGE